MPPVRRRLPPKWNSGAIQHGDGVSWQHFRCPDGTVAEIAGPGNAPAGFWGALLGIMVTGEHSDAGWATVGSRLDGSPTVAETGQPGGKGWIRLSPEGSRRPGSRPGPAASPSWQGGRSGCLFPL